MKDNLFEMLLNLFETSLTQLQKSHQTNSDSVEDEEQELNAEEQFLFVQPAQDTSTRVLTYDEQMKLTKASYQFLMRMKLWNIINKEVFESVLNQLQFSDSRIVTLRETKWTLRTILAEDLNEKQLAFLDLVLYQAEDNLVIH